ncbi:MAG: hypothetical protein QW035_04175 [Candidatus Anstonellales archaeon]
MRGNAASVLVYAVILVVTLYLFMLPTPSLQTPSFDKSLFERKAQLRYAYEENLISLGRHGGFLSKEKLWYCDRPNIGTIEEAYAELLIPFANYSAEVYMDSPVIIKVEEGSKTYLLRDGSRYIPIYATIGNWVTSSPISAATIDYIVENNLNPMMPEDGSIKCKVVSKKTGPLAYGDCEDKIGMNGTLINIACDDSHYLIGSSPYRFDFYVWTSH